MDVYMSWEIFYFPAAAAAARLLPTCTSPSILIPLLPAAEEHTTSSTESPNPHHSSLPTALPRPSSPPQHPTAAPLPPSAVAPPPEQPVSPRHQYSRHGAVGGDGGGVGYADPHLKPDNPPHSNSDRQSLRHVSNASLPVLKKQKVLLDVELWAYSKSTGNILAIHRARREDEWS